MTVMKLPWAVPFVKISEIEFKIMCFGAVFSEVFQNQSYSAVDLNKISEAEAHQQSTLLSLII